MKIQIVAVLLILGIMTSETFSQDNYLNLLNKGGLYTGLSFNFETKNTKDKDVTVYVIKNREDDNVNINLDQGYFIKDNFALGALINFSYNNREGIQENTSNVLEDVHSKSIGWSIYGTMKNYLSIDKDKRFNVFNLIKLGGTFENSLTETVSNDILTRIYTESKSIELLFYPGLMARVSAGFCIEAGLEIAGFKGEWTDSKINEEAGASESLFSADFTINILKVGIGFYYYY